MNIIIMSIQTISITLRLKFKNVESQCGVYYIIEMCYFGAFRLLKSICT